MDNQPKHTPDLFILSVTEFFGGGESFIVRFCNAMNHLHIVVVSPAVPVFVDALQVAGHSTILLPGSGLELRWNILRWLLMHRKMLGRSKVLLNGRGASYFAFFLKLIGISDLFVIAHTELDQQDSIKQKLFLLCCALAKKVIVVSETLKESFAARKFGRNCVDVLHWPVGMRASAEKIKQHYRGSARGVVIASRLAYRKGIDEGIAGFLLSDLHRLDVIGDGELLPALSSKYKEEKRVRFLGYVSGIGKKLDIYSVVLAPSHSESASLVLMEALQAGVLCICSDIPAHREMLGTGYPSELFFLVGDAHSTACALNKAQSLIENDGGLAADIVIEAQEQLYQRASEGVAVRKYNSIFGCA